MYPSLPKTHSELKLTKLKNNKTFHDHRYSITSRAKIYSTCRRRLLNVCVVSQFVQCSVLSFFSVSLCGVVLLFSLPKCGGSKIVKFRTGSALPRVVTIAIRRRSRFDPTAARGQSHFPTPCTNQMDRPTCVGPKSPTTTRDRPWVVARAIP